MIDWTSWMDYGFMKMALAAILIITPLFGLMGTMIVNKKMAYFSDALGHSALTGIAVGVVCGIPDTNISMVIFAVVFALLLNKIGSRSTVSTDTIISVFSSCSGLRGKICGSCSASGQDGPQAGNGKRSIRKFRI